MCYCVCATVFATEGVGAAATERAGAAAAATKGCATVFVTEGKSVNS